MSAPLEKPDHLRAPAEDDSFGAWIAKRKFAAAAGLVGVVSFLVVAIVSGMHADWRISVPGFALTVILAILSLVRREPRGYWVWGGGLALSAAALVIGWFLMMSVIVAGTVLAILILNALM